MQIVLTEENIKHILSQFLRDEYKVPLDQRDIKLNMTENNQFQAHCFLTEIPV